MTALHKIAEKPSPNYKFNALDQLVDYVQKLRSKGWDGELEQLERELHSYFQKAECEVLSDCITQHDIDVPAIIVDGEIYTRCYRGNKIYLASAGEIDVTRTLYRRKKGERAICPLELSLGVVESYWTPAAANQALWTVSHLTPGESEQLFKKLGNMTPSKSSLDRLPKKVGVHLEREHFEYQAVLSKEETLSEEAVVAALSLDGVMIPTRDKTPADKSCYKEASCGCLSFYNEDGERLSTHRFGRMPEHKKLTLKKQLSLELEKAFDKNPNLTLLKLADGALDNWTYLEEQIPIGGCLLDFYHMGEHLKSVFNSAYGEESAKSLAQFEKYKTILCQDYAGAELVIRAIEYLYKKYSRRKKIKGELTYFRNNRHRMWYALALEKNYPIGSGPVEATCKTLVTERMKRSGMRWSNKGGQAVLSFRALVQCERFDKTWDLIKKNYQKTVKLPAKVIPFPKKTGSV